MENKISQYKGLVIGREEPAPVTEREITDALNELVNRSTTFEAQDKVSELHDVVNINFEGFADGVAFEGGKGEDYDLELGSHTFIPGFEDQLVGYKKGDKVDVKVTFPENYHAENLKGKEAIFKCDINEVKVKKVANLDDELAKAHGLSTIEELRESVKAEIEHRNLQKSFNNYFEKVCTHIAANSEIVITPELEEKGLQNLLAYYQQMVGQYGMTLEQYLQMGGKTLEEFKEMMKPEAIKGAKVNAVLEYIAKEENLMPSEEEVNFELDYLQKAYHLNDEQLKEFKDRNLEEFKLEIAKRKVADFLIANNN